MRKASVGVGKLTAVAVSSAKVTEGGKAKRLSDGGGLFLEVSPAGSKYWRLAYRFGGKQKLLAFGVWPAVSLADARRERNKAREQLAQGIDPSAARKAEKLAGEHETFKAVALEWFEHFKDRWTAGHAKTNKQRLERDLFPWIGGRPVADIKAPELLQALRRVEARGARETAHRIKIIAGQVFRYAVATGRAERDPSGDLRGALESVQGKHYAAVTTPAQAGALLRMLDSYQGSFIVRCALLLSPLLLCRPGELRHMEWTEVNLDGAVWNIPAEKMKTRHAHLVPLSSQAVKLLQEIHPVTGRGRYVFPSTRSTNRPMSNNTINAAMRRMGIEKTEHCAHGFRAMARTLLDEELHVRPEYIEHQLAHAVRDPLGRAYNRTTHLPERQKMMQQWANYLDALRDEKSDQTQSDTTGVSGGRPRFPRCV